MPAKRGRSAPAVETRLLRRFVALAEELNIHRAAERLRMARPPLSQAIRKREACPCSGAAIAASR